ncbi:MAG: rod shape-determining protein RodA [Bacteroidetes bacterium]|nr:MAG: rod shape-determining protein RodA [Bacteroidota bacterium]
MGTRVSFFKNIDKTTVFIYLCMVIIGWFSIYAAEVKELHQSMFDFSQTYGKQFVWILTALVLATVIFTIDVKFFPTFAYIIFGIGIISLIGVLLFGTTVNASKSWFHIGGIAIQPAEFVKYATALALARLIYDTKSRTRNFKALLKPSALVAIPVLLIFLQNDTGTALVFAAFVIVFYREGYIPGWLLILGILAVFLFVLTLLFNEFYIIGGLTAAFLVSIFFLRKKPSVIKQLFLILILINAYVYVVDYVYEEVLQPHQKMRIAVLIDENIDLRGAGYNLHQSKIAIGSGGMWGKGFLQGTQTKFSFVPEQGTDFIFCTIGEEWGFMGSLVIVFLFVFLLIRIIILAERQRSVFSRIFGYSLAGIIFFHFLVNIGMTIGLVPVIGIPLPFISYGGSSLWAFTIFLFTFLKLDSKRLELM